MTTINPYLHFGGECRQALSFYHECLGGDLKLQTVAGSPAEQNCPGSMAHFILHGQLQKDGFLLMGSDMSARQEKDRSDGISLNINCSSEAEIDELFNRLSAGGKVVEPLKRQFWGAKWGVLTDQFGINWMLNFQETPMPF